MGFVAVDCKKCGANLEVDESVKSYTCKYCRAVHERDYSTAASPTPESSAVMAERAIGNGEFGKALQFVEQGLLIDPHSRKLLELEKSAKAGLSDLMDSTADQARQDLKNIENISEAEQYHLQAQFILTQLQANVQVYGSNSSLTGATPANIDLALQYIDRSLDLFPENPVYLNLKALLLMEGKGIREQAVLLLEKAAQLNPRDINIQNNLKAAKNASSCFIATAAFGSPLSREVSVLRLWRDEKLMVSACGRCIVKLYYYCSPPLARLISKSHTLRQISRKLLAPMVGLVTKSSPSQRK